MIHDPWQNPGPISSLILVQEREKLIVNHLISIIDGVSMIFVIPLSYTIINIHVTDYDMNNNFFNVFWNYP